MDPRRGHGDATEIDVECLFYRRSAQPVAEDVAEMRKIAQGRAAVFEKGGRYHLVDQALRTAANDARVVELGCGDGGTLFLLAERYRLTRATGIDIGFPEPVTLGPVDYLSHNLNHRWPFASGSVDHLISMMLFEHLFDPFFCFEETARVLAPRGSAYVNLPLVTSLKNRVRLLSGRVPVTSVSIDHWFGERHWDGNHLHYFSVPLIHRLAASCGLRVSAVRGVGRLSSLKTLWPSMLAAEITFVLRRVENGS
ncbi:class I SAM-dependent methyltransferase [Endothiovibrio diazotrophicus]